MVSVVIKHKRLSLNKTERDILTFLLSRVDTTGEPDLGYSTYASDTELQSWINKSRFQLHRALRHLESLQLLSSSHQKPFMGAPVLFSLTFPQYCQVKRLVGKGAGDLLAHYIHAYTRRTHNPVSAAELAINFNVKKRSVQRSLKHLVEQGIFRTISLGRYSKKRHKYVRTTGYELTAGQKPITHWIPHEAKPNS